MRILATLASPVVRVYEDVLSPFECQILIAQATDRLTASTVVSPVDGSSVPHAARTSQGCCYTLRETPLLGRIEARIATASGLPIEHGEGFQVLRYGLGGEYRPHFDYFPPDEVGSAMHLRRGGQRRATMILYLNTVERGGETVFPEVGLSVLPVAGHAVYFENTVAGMPDPRSKHGGAPVLAGEKWILTKWLRSEVVRGGCDGRD